MKKSRWKSQVHGKHDECQVPESEYFSFSMHQNVTETIKVACNYQKHMTLIATNVRLIINNKIKNTNTLTKKTAQRVL